MNFKTGPETLKKRSRCDQHTPSAFPRQRSNPLDIIPTLTRQKSTQMNFWTGQKHSKKRSKHGIHTPPACPQPRQMLRDRADTCTNTDQRVEHPQTFSKRSETLKKAKTPLCQPLGSGPMTLLTPRLEPIPPPVTAVTLITKGYLPGGRPPSRKNCARGSPPKSRYSGHQNSRLMRGASKQGQTKWLSYYMREGQMGNTGDSVRPITEVIEVEYGLNENVIELGTALRWSQYCITTLVLLAESNDSAVGKACSVWNDCWCTRVRYGLGVIAFIFGWTLSLLEIIARRSYKGWVLCVGKYWFSLESRCYICG